MNYYAHLTEQQAHEMIHSSLQKILNPETQVITLEGMGTMHIVSGRFHRDNAPAVIKNDSQEWYQHGLLHRENGPARIFITERKVEFWLNGVFLDSGIIIDQQLFNSYLEK